MTAKYWLKLWFEILDDAKMGRMPDNLWRRFIECCLLAGEMGYPDDHPENGRLPPIGEMAWRLRTDEETLTQEFEGLARKGMLDYRANSPLDGHWFVTHFNERQRKMTKAEYMRRLRGTPPPRYRPVTEGNIDREREREEEREGDREHALTRQIPKEYEGIIKR